MRAGDFPAVGGDGVTVSIVHRHATESHSRVALKQVKFCEAECFHVPSISRTDTRNARREYLRLGDGWKLSHLRFQIFHRDRSRWRSSG